MKMIKILILTCCLILIPQRGHSDENVRFKRSLFEDPSSIYHIIEPTFLNESLGFSTGKLQVPKKLESKFSNDDELPNGERLVSDDEFEERSDGESLEDNDDEFSNGERLVSEDEFEESSDGDSFEDKNNSNVLTLDDSQEEGQNTVDYSNELPISKEAEENTATETAEFETQDTTASQNDKDDSKLNLNKVKDTIFGLAKRNDVKETLDIASAKLNNLKKRVLDSESLDKKENTPERDEHDCLTGYMTDVQNWVDENGDLSPNIRTHRRQIIDLSRNRDPVPLLQMEIDHHMMTNVTNIIRVISLAKCNLKRVPGLFHLKDIDGRTLNSTLQYLTLYGNEFSDVGTAGEHFGEFMNATGAKEIVDISVTRPDTSPWTDGFQKVKFLVLKELDLRNCRIQQLNDHIFRNMPRLEALYLGENRITFISGKAFAGLKNLLHLDLSHNSYTEDKVMTFEHRAFTDLKNLVSIDFSRTLLDRRSFIQLSRYGKDVQRLSLCYTGIYLLPNAFINSSLRYLDISGNNGILSSSNVLSGLADKLEILYAKEIGLKDFGIFYQFNKLQLLNLERNEISQVSPMVAKTLQNLTILNLGKNRLTTWSKPIFSQMNKLKFLSLTENNINLISETMLKDIENISFVGFSNNFIVCNCYTRELYELAYRNQNKTDFRFDTLIPHRFSYHNGFIDFNSKISKRQHISKTCENPFHCKDYEDLDSTGDFQLFDFDNKGYECLMVGEAKSVYVAEVDTCPQSRKKAHWDQVVKYQWNRMLLLLILPGLALILLLTLYIYRRNLWYFCITMRNTATLSLINNGTVVDECTIFNYDVFVSYCNEDRNWVLDHLLPHVEKDCSIKVCLHERDFQVGLSILENIVSCMDRSRSILLIISERFLRSQWCQFEMHLAQHRLLETRREDLILVLLEEIPRRLRPTTLHYLMLTKTYIVWPKNESEYPVFWRRLLKSLVAQRLKTPDNVSLA